MDKIIVYVDDAAHALQQLAPMRGSAKPATTWIMVACPPRLAQHASKWVNHSAREKWRLKWSDTLFDQITPAFAGPSDTVVRVVASGKLTELSDQLLAEHGLARILDARCMRFGQDLEPVVHGQPVSHHSRWSVPAAIAGVGAVMALASE
jgi:hypothetical protein